MGAFLAWYRPAVTAALVRAMITAAILTTGGMTLVGFGFWSPRVAGGARPVLLAVGAAGILGGTFGFVWRLARLLWREDAYLGVRADGVDVHLGRTPVFVPWSEIAGVSLGEGGAVEIRRQGGLPPVRIDCELGGTSLPALATELEKARRRAAMGFLR